MREVLQEDTHVGVGTGRQAAFACDAVDGLDEADGCLFGAGQVRSRTGGRK
jgi:hypothetical protein